MTNYFQCEFKEIEIKQDIIKIKWWASTPDIDRYNDIVNPKAFNTAIINYMKNPVILLQHDQNKRIWKAISYNLNNKWLEVVVELSNNIENTFNLITEKVLKGFSIWFIPKKWEYKKVGDVEIREITELDLIEISVVSTPANPNSLFTLSKSIKSFFDNLLINNNIMEDLEVKQEVISDEVEIASENLETIIETEEKAVIIDDKADLVNEEIKSLKEMVEAQKIELEAQKSLIANVLDNVLELSKKTFEVKWIVENLPIKKGLATLWVEKKSVDPLYNELMKAKNNFN
jgi:HK97 family phage prohead protease